LHDAGIDRLLIFPLFPQYSATTTATSFDAVFAELARWRWVPALRTIATYHDRPDYIAAVTNSIRRQWQETGQPQRLLFSFHGIPQSYFLKGDPYYCHCQKTARLVASALELPDEAWSVSFQSRLGPQQWLAPDTAETLTAWGQEGLAHVDVVCPGFSADCLETTDEIGHEGRRAFQEAGGGQFHYVPALNDHPDHIDLLAATILENLSGWLERPMPDKDLQARVAGHRALLANAAEQGD
jgi:ferrochelatase